MFNEERFVNPEETELSRLGVSTVDITTEE